MAERSILRRCSLGDEREPEQLVDALERALRTHPQVREAFVFGSLANGSFTRHSDVDLIVVAETQRQFLERFRDFDALFEICCDLDLLVYTPAEIAKLRNDPSPGFWKSVWQQARRLVP